MENTKELKFEKYTFSKRFFTMLKVDFRRMFTMPLFYITVCTCFAMAVLILVMTTMMDGSVSVNPQTGEETVIEGFDNVWQIIGSVNEPKEASAETGDAAAAMDMSITSMCNINMIYFVIAVLVCCFVAADFRSGYAKNLFTVRSKKSDYVISKTVVCIVGAAAMIIAFFAGSLIGGAVSGLPFEMTGFDTTGLLMSMLSKVILVAVFVALYLTMSVIAKEKLWLSLILSFVVGMFLFMMIPMLTPLNSTILNVVLCLAGGVIFSIIFGIISNTILKKTSLV